MEIFILYSYLHVWYSDIDGTALVLESFPLLDRFSTSGYAWQYIWWVIFIVISMSKVGCVFPIVIWFEFRVRQYRDDDHREDASHFTRFPGRFRWFKF